MEFVNDPRKAKIAFVVVLLLAIVFFLASGALGYLYWHKLDDRNNLAASKQQVEESLSATLKTAENNLTAANKEIADLQASTDSSGQSISSLQKQIADYKAGLAKITAYKEFLKYYNSVIETHNGYTGWTDAEFQVGKTKAEATGDASFVSTVNWAWYETSVDVATRIIRVNKEIVSGIESGIK
ncbi:MAG: hypothetical protein WC451_00410 [Patescibacteria group bacterium]